MKALRVLLVVTVGWGCATNPATGRREVMLMSEAQEINLGRQSHEEIRQQMGVYNDQNLQRYINDIGQRLMRHAHRPALPWTFTVVDEPAVNAFAVPGGFVYVTRGILPFLQDESELAAVMAHEIGHVDARHSAQQYSSQTLAGGGLALLGIFVPETRPVQEVASVGLGAIFLKFGREDELEADRLGVEYSASAGWDPRGMPGLLTTLARLDEASGSSRGVPNWALTHPPAADRVVRVQEAVAAVAGAGEARNQSGFERYLDGLVVGDSREKGMVRGNEFVHPILRFSIQFPEGWQIINSDEQVSATPEENTNVGMLLQLVTGAGSVEQLATRSMSESGWQQLSGGRASVNGLDAYAGVYTKVSGNTRVNVEALHVRSGQQTYVVAGLAPSSSFQAARRTFQSSMQTFRALSAAEAARIQPDRLDFYVARPGDTWESIARSSGGALRPSSLAIMNGSDPGTPPRAGTRLRIVVRG